MNRSLVYMMSGALWPLVAFPLSHYLTVSPFGSTAFLWFPILVLPLFLVGIVGAISYAVALFVRRKHRMGLFFLLLPFVFCVSVYFGRPLGRMVRRAAFVRLAERSTPLVTAIRAYESKYGAPPPALAKLVPEFLPEVPRTGMRAYPIYRYYAGPVASKCDGNPWVLEVSTPSGGINFDTFIYFPLQNYPKTGYGGYLEPIRDWAYVHE